MEPDIQELVEEAFSNWVSAISFKELSSNDRLLRAIERFEKLLFLAVK